MKLYAPEYYKNFKCIADRCRHSCCIGWEIDIDDDTLGKYSCLEGGYGEVIKESIDGDGAPHFRLCKNDRCPHLDGGGLCNIIKELGEGYLCDICREHPRFYNDTVRGKEAGLGLCCEEACRIVLSSDDYDKFFILENGGADAPEYEFDPLPFRKKVFTLLSDRSVPYTQRLEKIYDEFGVSPKKLSDGEWRELLSSLEYLWEDHRSLFSRYTSSISDEGRFEKELERTLAYLVYRHVTSAEDENELYAALGFCLFCERLLSSVAGSAESFDEFCDLARIISEELEYSIDNTEAVKLEFLM